MDHHKPSQNTIKEQKQQIQNKRDVNCYFFIKIVLLL